MNPFELSGVTEEGDDELRMKLLALQGFFKVLLRIYPTLKNQS